jgi:hypothetical protein
MEYTKQKIIDLIEAVTAACGYERGVVCARDCLYQWKDGLIDETIEAWNRYLTELKNKDGSHTDENRHGAWVPAIPL